MHKKLIPKFQGGDILSSLTSYMNNRMKTTDLQGLSTLTRFDSSGSPYSVANFNSGDLGSTSGNSYLDYQKAKDAATKKAQTTALIGGAVNTVFSAGRSIAEGAGVKFSNYKDPLTEGAWDAADKVADIGLASGNMYAMIGGAVIKGANFLDQLVGPTLKDQGTAGINIRGYDNTQLAFAGNKLRFTNSGRKGALNSRISVADRFNTLAGFATQKDSVAQEVAGNQLSSLQNLNWQQLSGRQSYNMLVAKKGGTLKRYQFKNIANKAIRNTAPVIEEIITEPIVEENIAIFKDGGQITNVIPSGALHARRNNYEGDLKDAVTNKGIPVISEEKGGKIEQHAEIEKDEIIFHKEATDTIMTLYNKWNKASDEQKKELEIEVGKMLTFEIIENTEDNTGLTETVK